jgi:hypothetical protein
MEKKILENLKAEFPFGYRRFDSIWTSTFYVHTEALRQVTVLCRNSRIPQFLWHRVERNFLNNYGLMKWPSDENGKLYIQQELAELPEKQGYIANGLSELQADFLETINLETLEPEEKYARVFCKKYEDRAREQQKKMGVTDEQYINILLSDAYDNAGNRRVADDYAGEFKHRITEAQRREDEYRRTQSGGQPNVGNVTKSDDSLGNEVRGNQGSGSDSGGSGGTEGSGQASDLNSGGATENPGHLDGVHGGTEGGNHGSDNEHEEERLREKEGGPAADLAQGKGDSGPLEAEQGNKETATLGTGEAGEVKL